MPWTKEQNKLFRAAAHNPEIAKKHGMSMEQAHKIADEGVIHKRKKVVDALMKKKHG